MLYPFEGSPHLPKKNTISSMIYIEKPSTHRDFSGTQIKRELSEL